MEIKSLYKKFLKYSKPTAPKSKVQSKKIDVSKKGLWDKNKNKVIVPSNRITMKGPKGEQDFFKRPVLATGLQSGKQVLMQPGREYYFPNDEQVFEKRMQSGGEMLLDLASYIPGPIGIYASGVGLVNDAVQGDLWGVGLNTANILTGGAAKGAMSLARYAANAGARNTARGLATASHTLNRASRTANNVTQPIDKARTISSTGTYLNTQRTPQRESTYVAPRPRPIMQDGGTNPPDYSKFQEFNKTLPENLRNDNFKYNDPNTYDLYGMWEGSGKPNSFKDVQDGDFFPLQEDGTYHGFSVNPNTGEFLKPKNHATTWMEVREGQLNPNLKDQLIIQNERGRLQYVPRTMQDGGTVQTNMLQPIKKDEESLPIILESLFSQFQKSKEEFGVEPEESESMGTPSLQDGALVKDEDIRMDPIEINAELPPWYIRYPRKALRAANAKLEDWGAQYAQRISDATGGKDWYKEANPFGSLALEFMNAPQYTATYGVTGKVQTPSEAMDIQNPYGAFAVDALLDPMNVVGVGVSSKARNLFSQVPDQLNSSIARQINKNPRLALSLQRGRPINTSNVSTISGINPGDVSAFPDMVKRINPNTVSESTFFKQLEKGSTSLDSSLQKRISDLESKEGFKRLVDQEKDYLFYNSDLPEDTIERVAKINARSRIDELKNITNVNKEASEYASANFLNAGLSNPFTDNYFLYNNAFYKSGADDVISDIVSKSKGINLVKPTPNYSKSVPGEIGIGYNYIGNRPIEMHEIAHSLQRGRKLSVDDQLKNITPKKQLSADQQRVYNYFTKGSGGREPSAFANELRESMLQKGFIPDYYSPISQQQVQDAYTYFKKNPIGTYDKNTGKFLSTTRIFDFMDATKSNSKLVSDILNKLPAAAPVGVGAGMGISQLQNQKPAMQMGGMSIPGVNGTVIASTASLYKKHKARRK